MASAAANGITIEYETSGNPTDPPLLLIMGLGAQLIAWDEPFVSALVQRGFYVIRYDNRDVGRSTWFDEAGLPDLLAVATGGAALRPPTSSPTWPTMRLDSSTPWASSPPTCSGSPWAA